MKAEIAVLPGDGIGPEIMAQAVRILRTVAARYGHDFAFSELPAGGAAVDEAGDPLPEETLAACRAADAVLLGAVGGPKWDAFPAAQRPEQGLLRLRKGLGLFANLRPVRIYEALSEASPLKARILADGVDLLVVRELIGGIYFGERGTTQNGGVRAAFDVEAYDELEIARIAEQAFLAARGRRKKVTLVDKANVLDTSRMWRAVVAEVHAGFPDVALDYMYVDNCAMQLVRNPSQFDVILTNNLFGDILSDEASMITGSIGMLPSVSLGTEGVHLFEPIHGSAPDIAGKNLANPCGMILSAAMMLRYSFGLEEEALAVEKAVAAVLNRGIRTADLAGRDTQFAGTIQTGDAIDEAIRI